MQEALAVGPIESDSVSLLLARPIRSFWKASPSQPKGEYNLLRLQPSIIMIGKRRARFEGGSNRESHQKADDD
jgi:hypothetical protein